MDGGEHAIRVMDDGEDDGESAKQRKRLWVEIEERGRVEEPVPAQWAERRRTIKRSP